MLTFIDIDHLTDRGAASALLALQCGAGAVMRNASFVRRSPSEWVMTAYDDHHVINTGGRDTALDALIAAVELLREIDTYAPAPSPDAGGGKNVTVHLDDLTLQAAKAAGQGNISDGLRRMASFWLGKGLN